MCDNLNNSDVSSHVISNAIYGLINNHKNPISALKLSLINDNN